MGLTGDHHVGDVLRLQVVTHGLGLVGAVDDLELEAHRLHLVGKALQALVAGGATRAVATRADGLKRRVDRAGERHGLAQHASGAARRA